ncbi:MAG: hypothetical protein RIM72_04845 [Alphaproteobacteria bacterium]
MRFLSPLLLAALTLLTACDDASDVSVEYRHIRLHAMLAEKATTIPVVFHASPGSNVDAYLLSALSRQSEKMELPGLRFAPSTKRPLADMTIEVAYQPDRTLSGISLCQHKQIGGRETSGKSVTLAIALCHDGRRLSSVRGGVPLPGDTEGNAAALTTLIDGMTAALIGR